MHSYRVPIFLVFFLQCSMLLAEGYSIREWSNDIRVFKSQVLEPASEQFRSQECIDKTDDYLAELFSKLAEIKATIHSESYLLLRDGILITAADLTPWDAQINCSVVDKWTLLEYFILNEIELIGNVLLITE